MTKYADLYWGFSMQLDDVTDTFRNANPDAPQLMRDYFMESWAKTDQYTCHFIQQATQGRASSKLLMPGESEDGLLAIADYFGLRNESDRMNFAQGAKSFDREASPRKVNLYQISVPGGFQDYEGPDFAGYHFRLQPWGRFERDHIGDLVCVSQGLLNQKELDVLDGLGNHIDSKLKEIEELTTLASTNRDLRKERSELRKQLQAYERKYGTK